jgi:hypothetical protein
MMLKISAWMAVLREKLHIASIEDEIIAIELRIASIEAKIIPIDDALSSINIDASKAQALLLNEQKRLAIMLTEIGNNAGQLIMAMENERRHREAAENQILAEIEAMKNEMKLASDIFEQHIRLTRHDHQ